MSTTTAAPSISERHPIGLYALFGTEMWERLSYYGMRALLVLYLTKAIGMTRRDALGIYAVYTGLVYLTPLIGGRLADRYLGQRKAVFIGGILMALGQFALTRPELLYLGLGLLVLGNGFFKPNISTMVGGLYPPGDGRRDGAYTIFYMGINLGAFFAPLVCGPLGEDHGWWPGFATAGVGMTLGILTFAFTQRVLLGVGLPPGRKAVPGATLSVRDWIGIGLYSALGVALVSGTLEAWPYLRPVWSPSALPGFAHVLYKGAILIGLLAALLYLTEPRKTPRAPDDFRDGELDGLDQQGTAPREEPHRPLTGADWSRIVVILIISLFSVVFWMGFEQSGGTLNLFADEKTDRALLGREIPASVFQAVNPVFIILLAPVFAMLWTYLARRRFPLPSFAKQGLGLLLLSAGFGVMYVADELERPTSALAGKLDAATRAVQGDAGRVPLARSAPSSTAGQAIQRAVRDFRDTGEIPYKALEETTAALRRAGQADAARAVGDASREAAKSRVSCWWLIGVYFIFTVAELCLSPIGLALINRLAPARLASLMMASWFLCTAAANYLAGILEATIAPYHLNLWAFLGVMALVPGLLLLCLTPALVKMSHGRA